MMAILCHYCGSIYTPKISFSNTHHITNVTLNLIFISKLCDSCFSIILFSSYCQVQDPHFNKLIGTGRTQGGLYILHELRVPYVAASSVYLLSFCLSPSYSFYLWNSRLGHVYASRLKYLASIGN